MLQIRLKDGEPDDAVALTKKTVIGSHPMVDVVVGDEGHRDIWPTHCVISKAGKRHMLMALDAKAVVKLNGEVVQQAALKEGDVLDIGGFELLIELAHSATGDAVARLLANDTPKADAPEETKKTETGTRRISKRTETWGSDSWDLPFAGGEGDAATEAPPSEAEPEPEPEPAQDVRVEIDMGDMPEIGWGHQAAPTADAPPPPPKAKRPTTQRVVRPAPAPVDDDDGVRIEEPTEARPAARAPAPAPGEPEPIRPDDPLLLPKEDLPKRTARPKAKTKTIRGKRTASGRLQAIDAKGKLDVDASIRAHSKRVEVSELAKKSDTVRVLNFSTIKGLIDDAVAEAMATVGAKLEKSERDKLLKEAESEFKERLEAFQAEKAGLEAQTLTLQNQLKRAASVLEEERAREVKSDQFTMSEAGITDMEDRFGRMLSNAVSGGKLDPKFQAQIEEMIAGMLDAERDKIAEQARAAQSESIQLLEKKIRRLAGSLEEAEAEAKKQARRAAAMEAMGGGGIRGVEVDTGVDDDDPDAERKKELLKEIFQQNQAIRDQLGNLGVTLKQPPGSEERRKAREEAERLKREDAEELKRELAEERDADDAGIDASDDTADLDAPSEDLPEPVAASADGDGDGDDGYFGEDPDDQVWEPGMSFKSEPEFEEEDDGTDVKKLTDYKKFEPPPLERK